MKFGQVVRRTGVLSVAVANGMLTKSTRSRTAAGTYLCWRQVLEFTLMT